ELWRKAGALPAGISWHLIGHLQRNKIERTLPLVKLIHSVDSLRLLEAIDREAERANHAAAVLLEVNASQESSKSGFGIDELPSLAAQMCESRRVRILGLMTMAALTSNPEAARPTFRTLREMRT